MQRLRKSAALVLVLVVSVILAGCGEPEPEEMLSQSLEHLVAAKSVTSSGTATITVSINKQRIAELIKQGYLDSESAAAFAILPNKLVFYVDVDARYNENSYYIQGNFKISDELADIMALFGIPSQFDLGYYMSRDNGIYFKSEALAELLVMFEEPSYYGEEPLYPDFSTWQQVGDASETAELFMQQQLTRNAELAAKMIEAFTVKESRKGREDIYDIDVEIDMEVLKQVFIEQLESADTLTEDEKAEIEELFESAKDLFEYKLTYTVAKEGDKYVVRGLKGSMSLNPNAAIWSTPEVQASGFTGDVFGFTAEFEATYADLGAEVDTLPEDLDLTK